jgi:hypothetical protein
METSEKTPEIVPAPQSETTSTNPEADARTKRIVTIAIIVVIVILAFLIFAIYYLLQPGSPTDRIRDVFIIVVALESLVIGAALIILIIQLASLINLLQNEVRPILKSTSDTVNNLRGTAEFLGENMVEPVIKLNGYLAGMSRVIELMGFNKKK